MSKLQAAVMLYYDYTMTSKVAFFIDRDGVIDQMAHYPNATEQYDSPQKPEDVRLVEGIPAVIQWANQRRIPVIEITNQPSVAKGKMTQETSDTIEKKVHELLSKSGAHIDKVYTCPHYPHGVVPKLSIDCDCRKPKPGLLLRAAEDMNLTLSKDSVFLGDKNTDIEAGGKAGVTTILFLHEEGMPEKNMKAKGNASEADYLVSNMKEILPILKSIFRK